MEDIIKDLINDIQDPNNLNFKKEDELRMFFLIFFLNCIIENNNKFNNEEFLDFLFTEINKYCYEYNLEETGIFNFISFINPDRIKQVFDFKIPLCFFNNAEKLIDDNNNLEEGINFYHYYNEDIEEQLKNKLNSILKSNKQKVNIYYCHKIADFKISYYSNINLNYFKIDCNFKNININEFKELIEKNYFNIYAYHLRTKILVKRIEYLRNYDYKEIINAYDNHINEEKIRELKISNAENIRRNVIMQEYNKLFK